MQLRFRYKIAYICVLTTITIFFYISHIWAQGRAGHEDSPPNILFIVLDAARADHFSCYGYEKNTTPYMDAISRKGALFLNHFSNATYTTASMPKIFFSRYYSRPVFMYDAWRGGIRLEYPHTIFMKFDDQQVLLPELLTRHDYRTALFHTNVAFTKETYLVQKFDESFYFPSSGNRPADKEIITSVISWIKKNRQKKFFIYCHIMSPHSPYPPKEEDKEFFTDKEALAIDAIKKKWYSKRNDSAEGWTQKELEYLHGLYDSNLKHSDKQIGLLYDELKQLGLEDKTLVIISSDHGENLGQHGLLEHGGGCHGIRSYIPL